MQNSPWGCGFRPKRTVFFVQIPVSSRFLFFVGEKKCFSAPRKSAFFSLYFLYIFLAKGKISNFSRHEIQSDLAYHLGTWSKDREISPAFFV